MPDTAPSADAIQALQNRARQGILIAAELNKPANLRFWQGFHNALRALSNGFGQKLAESDQSMGGHKPAGCFQAAWAALPDNIERLSLIEVQQLLRTHGVKVPANAVAEPQVNAIDQLPGRTVTVVEADHELAVAAVDLHDGASLHAAAPVVADAAIVAQGGAA